MSDPVASLARAFDVAHDVIRSVPSGQWNAPSPCTEWDARGVANHLIGGAKMVAACVAGQPFNHADIAGDQLGDNPSQAYRQAADAAIAAFRADPSVLGRGVQMPFGEMPGGMVAGVFTSDHFTHAWDLAKATGQSTDLDPELAAAVLAQSKQFITADFRKPGFFDAEQSAPKGASAADQLAAFLGRKV